jgi:hypothetical protein
MKLDRLKKNVGWRMELVPPACHLDDQGNLLLEKNEDWLVEEVTDDLVRFSDQSGHQLKLGTDHIYSFATNPQRASAEGNFGFLSLHVQVFVRGAHVFVKPNAHGIQQRLDQLTSLGRDFRKAMECLQSMTRRFKLANEITIEEYSSLCEAAIASARKTFSNARILLPLALAEQCEKFFNCMFKGQSYLASALQWPVEGHQRAGFWDTAAKIAHEELPSTLAEIERTARNLIHSEPPSS